MDDRAELDRLRKMKRLRELEARLPKAESRPENVPQWSGPVDVDQGTSDPIEKLKNWFASTPPVRGSAVGRVAMGMADPGVAAVQLGANLIGQGDPINEGIQNTEQKYQTAREGYGSEGFDPLRMAGNIAMTAPIAGSVNPAMSMGQQMIRGGALGARAAALQPVTSGDEFWKDKAIQTATGYGTGAVMAPVAGALGRVMSPKGNPDADILQAQEIHPTIGQRLGGAWNDIEEKAQSIPVVGNMIAGARQRAREEFNESAINQALSSINGKVKGAGQDAVHEAHRLVSSAYDDALSNLKGVMRDPGMEQEIAALTQNADNMVPEMATKFRKVLESRVLGRMSPVGVEAQTFKGIDSELGELASKWSRSSAQSEAELGGAFAELRAILTRAAARQNPQHAAALKAADTAFAKLVRIDNASKAAKGTEGVFTPGQLISGSMQADRSARKNATAQGTALMQDFATRGQRVLGNKVPDSGTAGRGLVPALLALGGAGAAPAPVLGSMAAGALLYTPQGQRLAAALLSKRPPVMEPLAQALRQYAPIIGATAAPSVIAGQ